jgi:hypothetical protein
LEAPRSHSQNLAAKPDKDSEGAENANGKILLDNDIAKT